MTAPQSSNLFAQQEANRRRSRWLVVGFVLFFGWVGFGGDLAFGLLTANAPPGSYHHVFPFIGIITTLVAGAICRSAWVNGAKRVLWSTGAVELVTPATPEEKQLDNVVEEMAIASGMPKPKIWIVPDDDPNAFATGRDPQSANIAVTEGLLKTLNRDELQGVIGHEMAHIANWDTRLMTLLAGMVGAVALMSNGLGRMLGNGVRVGGISGGTSGGRGGGEKKSDLGGLGLVVLVLWLLTLVIAPIVTRVLAMAVSRKREFLADATGAQFTRNPAALASALEKLDAASAPTRAIRSGAAHLCIVDPSPSLWSEREGALSDVFASHPSIRERVARLQGMAYQFGPPASAPTVAGPTVTGA